MSGDARPPGRCPAESLKAWVDGELAAAAAAAVETHVRACPACGEEAEAMRRIGEGLHTLGAAIEPPRPLRERILAGIEAERQTPAARYVLILLRWGAAAGLAAVLAAMLFPVFATSRETARRVSASRSPAVAEKQGQAMQMQRSPPARPGSLNGLPQARDYDEGYAGGGPSANTFYQGGGVTTEDVRRYARGRAVDDTRRKVMQTADLTLRVARRVETVQDEVLARVKRDGGYAEESTLKAPPEGDRTAQLTLRVPVQKFESTLAFFSGLGEVSQKQIRGEDATGAWVDQRAEVRALRAEEQRLAGALRRQEAQRVHGDRIEAIRSQLVGLRGRIESAEQRFALTGKLAALATVRLTLTEPGRARAGGGLLWDLQDTLRAAFASFLVALRVPVTLLIWLVVFVPLWVPCVFVFRWAGRMVRR